MMQRGRAWCARWVVAVGAALVTSWPAGAPATTYYVRAGGDDAADGLTPATALASVRPAARRLREPGDRLIVGPGTYREGNVSPFGNGTPDAPIVLTGDASGAATGDPPGPVTILPPNTPAATSGFLVRGRSDVVIEGFEIATCLDACIDVRPRWRRGWSAGLPSTRIALRGNHLRDSKLGIKVDRCSDVEVSGNQLLRLSEGLALVGSTRLAVSGNVFADGFVAMTGSQMSETLIANNDLQSTGRNFMLNGDQSVTLTGNRLLGPNRVGEVFAARLTVLDNAIEARAAFGATDALEVRGNTARAHIGIRRSPAQALIVDNSVAALSVGGGGAVTIERNAGQTLRVEGVADLTAAGNRFDEVNVRRVDTVELADNDAGAVTVRGAAATVRGNRFARRVRVVADAASVADNTTGGLTVQAREFGDGPPTPDSALDIRGNAVAGPLAGLGADTVRVQANRVDGPVTVMARRVIEIVDTEAHGIAAIASVAGSGVTMRENRSRNGSGPGLAVVGAERATVERNVASGNAGNGLVVRRVAHVTATGNELSANGRGGASVRVPPVGDCDEDADVTIGDLLTAVCVAMQRRPRHDCDAADADRDRVVRVHELVLAVGAALGRPDPVTSAIELRDNRVEHNARFGIDVYARGAVTAVGNRVLRNGGIPLAVHGLGPLGAATIAGNLLGTGAAEGLFVEAVDAARVRNNVVFGNRDAGILLRATPGAAVSNNLVYANGGPGIAVGVDDRRPVTDVLLANNTVFANGGWGIVLGSGDVASTGTRVRDNIVHQNVAGGIAAAPGALVGLAVEFNLNTGRYGAGVTPGSNDLAVDPRLVAPAGADGVLGDAGYADDDFHLLPDSPAIDAGSAPAATLGVTGSAVAGREADEGVVDLGYHYGANDR